MTTLRSLLQLPETVAKGHFVVRLTEGIEHPEALLRDYAVTPDLAGTYDKSLALVRDSLDNCLSAGAYVHGSFGSGKSHFLAVLSLILAGDATPWSTASLHATLAKHEWVRSKRLMRLHFHVVGANSLEEKIFAGYLDFVKQHHPEALVPALFQDTALFDNADAMRKLVGDDPFFAKLNEDPATTSPAANWGSLRPASRWHAATFEETRRSNDPRARGELFSALVKTWFPAFASQHGAYIGIDKGLAVLSNHAHTLGYDGVVLFLDELILWLLSRAADSGWLSQEAQKVAKLVEAQDAARPIPIISLVARQRDISQLIGDAVAGSNAVSVEDSLRWWQGRFDTVTLPDRNLPAIIAARVIKPKDEAARATLNQAYANLQRGARGAWATLLGEDWNADDFRQVYPFSPALVQSLVALSHYLQRERTALKVLMEMLVEHLEDFQVGKLVAVGDLFDVLAGGEDPMDGRMRELFTAAQRLYRDELLPEIQKRNGTHNQVRCQRMRDDHPLRLGCANCPETQCRADNRMVKTLLLAALVPEVPVFKRMTASRLVALNHGTLEAVIPGREAQDAVLRLRDYAAEVGKLHVGDQDDPTVGVALEGVDVRPLLDQEKVQNSPGARRKRVRELLFLTLGLTETDAELPYQLEWRGTIRKGSIRFGNVREMDDSVLECKVGDDFRVVVDYPFDEPEHHPSEDEARVQQFMDRGKDSSTLVWLPSFFSDRLQRDLGDLVVIEHIVRKDSHTLLPLSPEDKARAVAELTNLAEQKRARIRRALTSAYGVTAASEGDLDDTRRVDKNLYLLRQGLKLQGTLAADLKTALDKGIGDLLYQCFPRHPQFSEKVTQPKLVKALERFQQVCDAEGNRVQIDKAERKEFELAAELGFLGVTDTWAS